MEQHGDQGLCGHRHRQRRASSAFTLANGGNTVPYTVQWANTASQTAGTALVAGTASTGKTSLATQNQCLSGPADSASLIVGISTADLGTMQAGVNYTGTLTLVVAPE